MYAKGAFDLDKLKRKLILKKEEGNFGFSLVCNSKRLGNYIKDVVPDSVAEKAGIRPGDRVIQIGDINIIGFQPIEIVKLLSNHENRLEIYVVEEKFYKVFLKQNEYPQISSPMYDEKNIDGSVFVKSSDERISTTSTTNRARMYDFEAAAVPNTLITETITPSAANTPNNETYRTLNTASSKTYRQKKDILVTAWSHLKSCFKAPKNNRHHDYSMSEPYDHNNAVRNITFPTPRDEAVMTNTNASMSSTMSNEYGISHVRIKGGDATKTSKVNPNKTLSMITPKSNTTVDNVSDYNRQLAEKSHGCTRQQNEKCKVLPPPCSKKNQPPNISSITNTTSSKYSPLDTAVKNSNEVVIQFEHPKIIFLNSTERDIEV